MNTSWKYEVGGQILCQFLTWESYLALIGQGVQVRIVYYSKSMLKEIFFFLQKLSFPLGKEEKEKKKEKKIEIQIIFNNTFFQFLKNLCWLKIQFSLHIKLF